MRTKLCYLALILIPVAVYSPLLLQTFGTPEDLARLTGAGDGAAHGILYGGLVDITFNLVGHVGAVAFVRGLSVLFLVLTALALWQLCERGGWGEWDALAVSLSVVLLPSSQLAVGWATNWPGLLAALLSIAGFAAAESELEPAGARRVVGMLGGVLLYFAAAMCYLPNALMALVPLAALTLARPLRLASELGKWFRWHALLMLVGIIGAWLVERWMMSDAGIADRSGLAERLISLGTFSVPAGWAVFLVGETGPMRIVCAVMALAVLATIVCGARYHTSQDARGQTSWLLALLGPLALFVLVAIFAPHWKDGYHTLWPLAGVVVVALAATVRGVGDRTGKKPLWHFAALGGMTAVAVFAAVAQMQRYLVVPLRNEWQAMRARVMRANFSPETRVLLVIGPEKVDRGSRARFSNSIEGNATWAQSLFGTALRDRFPAGLPKNHRVTVETVATPPLQSEANTLVMDLRQTPR